MSSMDYATRSRLTKRIREEAYRLGFFKVGIAPAGPLPRADRFDKWLHAGMHGEMRYMERQADRRRDPSLVLTDVRSILVLAASYHTETPHPRDPSRGYISRYSWGDDYHVTIGSRLRALQEFILLQAPAARSLWYTDTGPVMEKVWGAHCGLGWIGKHTNLITREQGSWFFIGVILLNLGLEPDAPDGDYCGTCSRCVDACPTRAIVAPYVVDARLCVSYLTIEMRGPIPRHLRPLIGNRIFGCDDCQEVCPWNRFAVETPVEGLRPREGNREPELASLVSITNEQFQQRFAGTAIRRTGRDGLVRNVAVALGNSGEPEAVRPLAVALEDSSTLVRAHAAWALGSIGTAEARGLLIAAALKETDHAVQEEISAALDSSMRPE